MCRLLLVLVLGVVGSVLVPATIAATQVTAALERNPSLAEL
jgi:hypothetical protein